jgi:hypothetical protein
LGKSVDLPKLHFQLWSRNFGEGPDYFAMDGNKNNSLVMGLPSIVQEQK